MSQALIVWLACIACAVAWICAEWIRAAKLGLGSQALAAVSVAVLAALGGAQSSLMGLLLLSAFVLSWAGEVWIGRRQNGLGVGAWMAIAARLLGCVALMIHGVGLDGVLFFAAMALPIVWAFRDAMLSPGRGRMLSSWLLMGTSFCLAGLALGACWRMPGRGEQMVFLGSVFWLCSSGAWSLSRLVQAPRSVRTIVGQAAYFPAQASLVWGGCLL